MSATTENENFHDKNQILFDTHARLVVARRSKAKAKGLLNFGEHKPKDPSQNKKSLKGPRQQAR